VYGTVRTVVWEDGGGDPASYPIDSFSLQIIFPDYPNKQKLSEFITKAEQFSWKMHA